MKKKIQYILQSVLFVGIIIGFIIIGKMDFSKKITVDNEKFDYEYANVSKDNVFTYANASEVLAKLKSGNSIIFMGYPKNKWSGYYANILNDAAKEVGIKEIFYYDFYEDRNNNNATFQSIVLRLSSYLIMNDNGKQNIYAPTLVVIKNGQVFFFDDETSLMRGIINPKDYWSKLQKDIKLNEIKTMLQDYMKK